MNLLIVESPNKVQKIKGFLGSDWLVGASVGHIRDIPGKELGMDRAGQTYTITYAVAPDKVQTVASLKAMVAQVGKANVYLATDPDREGEGISFHLCEALGLDKNTTKRVTFMEITEPAIRAALGKSRTLDQDLVAAQEARRAIDRLVGWEVSPTLMRSQPRPPEGTPGFSAGRVQSVAARLVADLEDTIEGFAAGSGLSFPVSATFTTPAGEKLPARYVGKSVATEAEARAQLARVVGSSAEGWRVLSIEQSPVSGNPLPAYSTSSLQMDGVKKLKFSVAKISELAQKLFEAGHVTYIRTDSVNIGEEGTREALAQITQQYGANYACARKFKEKPGVQGGHEAIRPTHWNVPDITKVGATVEEQALYQLIYTRTLASQMSPAQYAQTVITVGRESQAAGNENEDRFESRVKILTFPGYRAAYTEAEEEAESDADAEGAAGATLLTPLAQGDALALFRVQATGRMQKPPKRFDEATLVGELEKRQIGRPSTYASILKTIFAREYVKVATVAGKKVPTKTLSWEAGQPLGQLSETARSETLGGDKAKLVPTDRGRAATKYLKTHFAELVDFNFTAQCEELLDQIAEGKLTYVKLLRDFDARLLTQKAAADASNPAPARARNVGEWKGLPILAANTKFGPSLRYGPVGEEQRYNLPEPLTPETVTLEQAIAAIEHGLTHKMRQVGEHEKMPIEGGISKAEKPYLRWKDKFYNLPEGVTLERLTPDMARAAIVAQVASEKESVVHQIDKKWSILRKPEGQVGLWLSNGEDRCTLRNVSEEEAKTWDKDMAQAEMKRFNAWKAKQPAR
jgi:DNA topoisomerase-1